MDANRPQETIRGEFAFWGPPQSGKDWMIHSFARSLAQYNLPSNSRYDPNFEHVLTDESGLRVSTEAPAARIQATVVGLMAQDQRYFYQRRSRANPPTPAQRISAQHHVVRVTNASGGDTLNLNVPSVRETLENVQCILLLLDPTLISAGTFTQADYYDAVKNFLDSLEGLSYGQKRYIAACLTKVDTLTTIRDAREQILLTFGRGMEALLTGYNSRWPAEVEFFAVSSFGFLAGKREPNINDTLDLLKDPNHWQPLNVEQPFFWLFERLEMSRLQTFNSSLARAFFEKERQNLYINYPRPKL